MHVDARALQRLEAAHRDFERVGVGGDVREHEVAAVAGHCRGRSGPARFADEHGRGAGNDGALLIFDGPSHGGCRELCCCGRGHRETGEDGYAKSDQTLSDHKFLLLGANVRTGLCGVTRVRVALRKNVSPGDSGSASMLGDRERRPDQPQSITRVGVSPDIRHAPPTGACRDSHSDEYCRGPPPFGTSGIIGQALRTRQSGNFMQSIPRAHDTASWTRMPAGAARWSVREPSVWHSAPGTAHYTRISFT